jgi:hypothetical protein
VFHHEDPIQALDLRCAGRPRHAGGLQDGERDLGDAEPAVLVTVVLTVESILTVLTVLTFVEPQLLGWRPQFAPILRKQQPGIRPGDALSDAGAERLCRRQPLDSVRRIGRVR